MLLELGKSFVDKELGIEDMVQELPMAKDIIHILKETQINEFKINALAPKSFLEIKVKIPGLKEVAERLFMDI